MTILVTGAAGHLGEGLVRSLRAQGIAVRGTDRLETPFVDAVGDLRNPDFVRDAVAGCDRIVHRRVWRRVQPS